MSLPPTARTQITWTDMKQPHWAILGAPLADRAGVVLLASTKLTRGQLQALHTDEVYVDQLSAAWIRHSVAAVRLTLDMGDYTLATGPTYGEALEELFRRWQPPADPDPASQPSPDLGVHAITGEPVPAITATPQSGNPTHCAACNSPNISYTIDMGWICNDCHRTDADE